METFDDKNFPKSRMVRENFSRPLIFNFGGRLRRHSLKSVIAEMIHLLSLL